MQTQINWSARKLDLLSSNKNYYLTQKPIDAIYEQRDFSNSFMMKKRFEFGQLSLYKVDDHAPFLSKFNLFNIEINFEINGQFDDGEFGVRMLNDVFEYVRVGYIIKKDIYYLDRRKSGISIHKNFSRQIETKRLSDQTNRFQWSIILDVSSVEFFADKGLNAFTGIFYPTKYFNQIEIYAFQLHSNSTKPGLLSIQSLAIHPMKSIWK